MLMQKEREEIVYFGKKMSADGLSAGTSGNLSVFDAEKRLMAISPSGIEYFETLPEDVVVMDMDGTIIDGNKKPSSEWNLHLEFYKAKPHLAGIVHAHSRFCTTFAVLGQSIKAVHYVIGDAGAAEIPCAPYRTFGTKELAEISAKAAGRCNAVLLENHGVLAGGSSLKSAYGLACNLEFIAEVQYRAMSIGKPIVLSDEEMGNVMERFKSYGQAKKDGEKSCY